MAFKWNSDLATGDALIDGQHQGIFIRVNRLLEAMMAGCGEEEIGRFARFLEAYVAVHFTAEEQAMRQAGYPDLDRHAAAHASFRADLACLFQDLGTGQDLAHPVLEVQRRVCDWLLNHICKSDRAFADFMRSRL